jgi:hypothetical protein
VGSEQEDEEKARWRVRRQYHFARVLVSIEKLD